MSNSGFELGLGFVPISHKDMELNINVNMSWQKNKLISLSGYYNGNYMSASNITALGSLNGAGLHGGDATQPELLDQPVLVHTVAAFHSALRLR